MGKAILYILLCVVAMACPPLGLLLLWAVDG